MTLHLSMRLFKFAAPMDSFELKNNKIEKYRNLNEESSVNKTFALSKFITSDTNPEFFIHFGAVDRVGINPRSKYNTPNGVYCYPLTQKIFKDFVKENLPFAQNQPYIHVISSNSKLTNMKNYSEQDLKQDVEKLKQLYNPGDDMIEQAFQGASMNIPIGKMWNLTRLIANNPNRWNKVLRSLGYTGFYDPGLGLIYHAEPIQCVILETTEVIRVKTIMNPRAHNYVPDHTGNKQDANTIEKVLSDRTKLWNSHDVYLTVPQKLKKFYGIDPKEFGKKIDIGDLMDQDKIRSRFNKEEIVYLINDSEYSDSLRILYYDIYRKIEQRINLQYAFTNLEDIKVIPLNVLVEALQSIGLNGVYQMLQYLKANSFSIKNQKNVVMLENLFANNSKKHVVKEIERNIELETDGNPDNFNVLSNEGVFSNSAKQLIINQIIDHPAIQIYVANNQSFFERLGGPVGLSSEERTEFLKNFSVMARINKYDRNQERFNGRLLAYALRAYPKLETYIGDHIDIFEKLGGPPGLSLKDREIFIKSYMHKYRPTTYEHNEMDY